MAATAYTSVRRCSTSSTGSSGSGYSDAEAGALPSASKTSAARYTDVDGDDYYEEYNKFDNGTKGEALSSSQPPFPANATPSPANFLPRVETSLTPMSMDSDLFPDRDFDGSRGEDKTGSPRQLEQQQQQQQQQSTSPASAIPTSGKWSSSSSPPYAVRPGHGYEYTNTSTTSVETASPAAPATAAMRLPHASATCPAAAAAAAASVVAAASAAGDKQRDVSGARQDDATEIEAAASHSSRNKQSHDGGSNSGSSRAGHDEMGEWVMGWNDDAREGNKGEEAEAGLLAISPKNPRQRRAGTTPLSLDVLQMVRGNEEEEGDNDKERDSAPAPTNTATAATATATATATASCSPTTVTTTTTTTTTQPASAVRTENIIGTNNNSNRNNNIISSIGNTAVVPPNTSPAASVSSPSTIFSAPAAFTRQLSTTSSPSTSSLVSQIQENLLLQQNLPSSSSSAANLVRPVAKPIVRTTSDSNFTLKHPIPDLNCRSGAYTGNVAALEKSAERLSMTSSIEDAIRDLHGELKRSDSRRSSILAANLAAAAAAAAAASPSQIDESSAQPGPLRVLPPVASIVELNNAARYGGYSPSGYVMSPNHSLTGRLRSGSKNSSGRPEIDVDAILSRHGPGKGSSRSVRSAKPSLAEISESEPVALTGRVLDEADHAPVPVTAADDATIRRPNTRHDEDRSGSYHDMLGEMDHQSSGLGLDFGGDNAGQESDDRPPTPKSTSTFDHTNVFGDFDGVHCQPEDVERAYDSHEPTDGAHREGPIMPRPQVMPMPDIPEPQWEPVARRVPPTNRAGTGRPQSYFDPLTGQEMLYYPARVPAMLNLPPKLSKKPKTEVRNARHSKVLQAMGHPGFGKAEYLPQDPEAGVRESKMWLPDPLAGHGMTTFGDVAEGEPSGDESMKSPVHDSHLPSEQADALLARRQSEDMPQQPPSPTQQRRKSKMLRASQLPPQLRASAFFDLPSISPKIEIKEGSPMATLDSILDASTTAPVSAFTDHAFAGKLGSEVYGPDKKKNRKSAAPTVLLPEEHVRAASQKKKGGLMPFGKKSDDGSRKSSMADGSREENQGLSDHVDGDGVDRPEGEGSEDDGEEEKEEEEDEFAGVLDGPPTTLLAELQLRKYHARMRTQNPNRNVGQNGMHATLIELDAVAEAQKRHREKKKIALAWEDGAKDEDGSSDEDDVPLGVLYAHQPAIAEMHRPMGLMERRDQEENEPLSARRARLHGQQPPPRTLAKQRSHFTLNAGLSQFRLHQMHSAEHLRPREESDDDEAVEGETLAERMRRLRAKDEAEHNNLPSTRPVSKMFSEEILAQFGEPDKQPEDKGKEVKVQPNEAEETLGQRRKRLQAEREARDREMMLSGGPVEPEASALRRKHSLADVLALHPTVQNPAWEEQRRLEQEQRKVKEQEAKLAAVRAQMPKTLTGPNLQRTGGYMNGAFNDGSGGLDHHRPAVSNGVGVGMGPGGWNRSSMAFSNYGAPLQQPSYGGLIGQAGIAHMSQNPTNGYGGYTAGGMGGMGGMGGVNPYGGGMGMPMQMQPIGAGMGMQQGMAPMQMPMQPGHNGQMQSIERWRQSVMY
ncbi:uncharacterized protein LY79DRAFT_675000 [Colletotrichum navitas]|uniref:Uncharacterized protein n=1 Tax=Colletotrichum navitas TaxID=681940 RepID=A0AAD8PJS0_9PEZI|nr:uncharacterized protein LY79DRAFT_675000 [Colletotrichum navitas]KAK1566033.1 hypothetical protein LY79DRAFT_675000 [Colletotrichum navitas]